MCLELKLQILCFVVQFSFIYSVVDLDFIGLVEVFHLEEGRVQPICSREHGFR